MDRRILVKKLDGFPQNSKHFLTNPNDNNKMSISL